MRLRKIHIPCGLGWAALLGVLVGCPPSGDSTMEANLRGENADAALRRINDNLARISDKVECRALVSFRFRDAQGQLRQFRGHEATLRFRPPQCLRFDVRGLAGVIAQFGSNDDRYWVWVEPEMNKLWWGSWGRPSQAAGLHMPVPPQRLLDGLMLRELPATLEDQPPELRRDGGTTRLVYYRADGGKSRELRLTAGTGMPFEINEYDAHGDVVMRAKMQDYQRIGARGPLLPRRYLVEWPASEGYMDLKIRSADFRPTLPDWFCEFPERWSGSVESLDSE